MRALTLSPFLWYSACFGINFSLWIVTDADSQFVVANENRFVMPDSDDTVNTVFMEAYSINSAEVMYGRVR